MKIKVIDLLNKIANGEEIPKKIKHWQEIYELKESIFIIYENKDGDSLDLVQCLTDEVEIIEEDNKIEKIQWDFDMLQEHYILDNLGLQRNLIAISDTINQIIDRINKMEE